MTHDLELGIEIGQILGAYTSRRDARRLAKDSLSLDQAKRALDSAKRDYSAFGGFEDCGPSYEADLAQAQAVYDHVRSNTRLVDEKIRLERKFKAMYHRFIEANPAHKDRLDALLSAMAREHHATSMARQQIEHTQRLEAEVRTKNLDFVQSHPHCRLIAKYADDMDVLTRLRKIYGQFNTFHEVERRHAAGEAIGDILASLGATAIVNGSGSRS